MTVKSGKTFLTLLRPGHELASATFDGHLFTLTFHDKRIVILTQGDFESWTRKGNSFTVVARGITYSFVLNENTDAFGEMLRQHCPAQEVHQAA